jgi:hypothetical protein
MFLLLPHSRENSQTLNLSWKYPPLFQCKYKNSLDLTVPKQKVKKSAHFSNTDNEMEGRGVGLQMTDTLYFLSALFS